MANLSFWLFLLVVIGSSSCQTSPESQKDDSWSKLEISPRVIASMPFNSYRINIYESSGGLKISDEKSRKYYYAPISLLHHPSAESGFNNATGEAEMRFRVYFWTESVEKEVFNYLTKVVRVNTSIHQVHVIPFEKVILVSTKPTVNYRVNKEWISYQTDQYLEFRIFCDTLDICNNLAEQMRYNPQQFAHLKLQFSLDSQRSKRRETIIKIENVVSGSMFSKLDQKLPNTKEVYLTAADTKKLLSESVSNVLAETFSDDEILHQGAEAALYNILEKFIVSGKTEINEQSKTMWDSVFWDKDNYRPDRSSKTISDVYRKSDREAQQKMVETFNRTEAYSVNIGLTFGKFGFNSGFTTENSNSNSKEKEDFLKLMNESKDNVQWEGETFVPKAMQLSRVNMADIRNAQNFRDIRTQVIYTQSVLSTTLKILINSEPHALKIFVTESKLNDALTKLLAKIDDSEKRIVQATTVQLKQQLKDSFPVIVDLTAKSDEERKQKFFTEVIDGNGAFVRGWTRMGLDVNVKDSHNSHETALHKAAYNKNPLMLRELLKAGADFEVKNDKGDTPLHTAAALDTPDPEFVGILLEAGANPNEKNNQGWTPLHSAAYVGWPLPVTRLLDAGADPNVQDNKGWTPLHLPVNRGYTQVPAVLLKRGADRNIRNKDGKTPVDLAKGRGSMTVFTSVQ